MSDSDVIEKTENKSPEENTGNLDFEQARRAIITLQEYAARSASSSKSEKAELFSDERSIYLEVVMKKYPLHLPAVSYLEILLPHPFHDPQAASSCIIVRDVDKHPPRRDLEKSSRIYKDFFAEEQNLSEPTEVISVKQLLAEYKTYEAKRKLCHSYDVFMADARLGGHVTKWLGREFILTKKVPFFIDVKKRVAKNFRRVFALTRAVLTPSTLKFTVKIGRLNQPADNLVENLKAVRTYLADRMPGKWENVRSAYIGSPSILDLPVYVDWGSSNAIRLPKSQNREATFVEGELTTLRGKKEYEEKGEAPPVRVFSDGTIRIGKSDKKRQLHETTWTPPRKRPASAKGSASARSKKAKVKRELKKEKTEIKAETN